MRCILIFDHLNDVLFSKYDKQFSRHLWKLGKRQGLISDNDKSESSARVSNNILIQLFSPVVTSQQIMTSQFGNSYTSIQCFDGTNMVFDEYMGFLFVHVGYEDLTWLKRMLSVCISIVQHLCGPDVADNPDTYNGAPGAILQTQLWESNGSVGTVINFLISTLKAFFIQANKGEKRSKPNLKHNQRQSELLSLLLDTWSALADSDQACLVEAVEQMSVSPELNDTVIKTLRDAANKLKSMVDYSRCHALIFVDTKFLSLYSSRDAEDLAAADILFLNILTQGFRQSHFTEQREGSDLDEHSSEEFFSPPSSPLKVASNNHNTALQDDDCFNFELVILSGNGILSPHAVHMSTLTHGVSLLLLYQTSSQTLCGGLHDTFSALVMVQNLQISENGEENIRKVLDLLDGSMKKVFDALKKNKYQNTPQVENVTKQIHSKWDQLKRKLQDAGKDKDAIIGLDTMAGSLQSLLRVLLRSTSLDRSGLLRGTEAAELVTQQVRSSLTDFTAFLKVKAIRNFTLGSTSLTINKYLEEFPGLVHFMYIDRSNHRVTAPSLDFSSEETITLTKKKIWSMVELSRTHLQDGHLAVMWKDTTFNYAYYLWFEDNSGSPIKPKVCPSVALKSLPMPGIICGDFYRKLVEACFPKLAVSKVQCLELYCIHLGLATSACVLEHSRRLAATIFEVTGQPNPLDIL